MTEQLTMFDNPQRPRPESPPAHNRTDTSKAAAKSIASHAKSDRERVFEFVRRKGSHGATNYELVTALDMKLQSVCPRVNELVKEDRLVESDKRRKTPSNRLSIVWVCAEIKALGESCDCNACNRTE